MLIPECQRSAVNGKILSGDIACARAAEKTGQSTQIRGVAIGMKGHTAENFLLTGRISYFSLEEYADKQTPPAFIWQTAGDHTVPVRNSLCFAERLAAKGVPFELHIYPYGEHGLSLATREVEEPEKKRYADAHVAGWFKQCMQWLDMFFCKSGH